jgi:hypothetical protein
VCIAEAFGEGGCMVGGGGCVVRAGERGEGSGGAVCVGPAGGADGVCVLGAWGKGVGARGALRAHATVAVGEKGAGGGLPL